MISNPIFRLIALLLFTSYSCRIAYAQSSLQEPVLIRENKQVVFDKIIDYMLEEKFFIKFSDFTSGQLQYVVNNRAGKKTFSTKEGERFVVNVILREINENKTSIQQQVNVEELFYKNYVFYSNDQGVTTDLNIYKPLLDSLLRYLDKR